MSLTIYEAAVPALTLNLQNLHTVLGKGAAYATERSVEDATILGLRLFPDMLHLARNVQVACDISVRGAARLAGADLPSFPDDETTIADLQARVAKAREFILGIPAAAFNGAETREISMMAGQMPLKFHGKEYLADFVLPNVYFHVTVVYANLRTVGVPVGKFDYLGALRVAA